MLSNVTKLGMFCDRKLLELAQWAHFLSFFLLVPFTEKPRLSDASVTFLTSHSSG